MKKHNDDDGRTVADMSGIEPMPLLIPRPDVAAERNRQKAGEKRLEGAPDASAGRNESIGRKAPVRLERGERFAMIRGALAACLLVGAAIAAAFAAVIFLIGRPW